MARRSNSYSDVVRLLLMAMGTHVQQALAAGTDRKVALESATSLLLLGAPLSDEGKRQLMTCGIASVGAAWAECGFPTLEPSHKLAASLMATAIPNDTENLIWPWRCFCVEVPSGLLEAPPGHAAPPRFVIVLRPQGTGSAFTFVVSDDYVEVGEEPRLAEYGDLELGEVIEGGPGPEAFDLHADVLFRMTALIGRLIVGSCIEVEAYRPSRSTSTAAHPPRTKRGMPKQWIFKLGRPVKLDVREQVRSFSRGGGVGPTVQVLVRGHWKRQPFGPGRSERKWTHIEPYWRGPEDAPVLVRPTKVES